MTTDESCEAESIDHDKNEATPFVFIDDQNKPFFVSKMGEEWWLFYWHPRPAWVTLRKITQMDYWQMKAKAIPDDQAELYHQKAKAAF